MKKMAGIDDIEICYEQMGSGPPLIMIMGYTANMDWWSPLLQEGLSSRYTVTMFDNRGAGRSATGYRRFTMKQFAADTAGLMKALGIERAHIMGASMGGMIAQQFALDYPTKVDRLVLCCTTCGGLQAKLPGAEVIKKLVDFSGTSEERLRRSVDILFTDEFRSEHPEVVDDTVATMSKAIIAPKNAYRQAGAILGFRTYQRLPLLYKKALVNCGEEDVLIPPANSDTLAARMPNATLRRFPKSGHGFTTQCAREVADTILEFLDET